MSIGNRLKEIRNDIGLSQLKMAQKFNISDRTYKAYELDHRPPSLKFINDICVDEGISLSWLITGDGVKKRL